MKKPQQYVIINPKSERKDYVSYDARVPLKKIRVGTMLKLLVNVIIGSRSDDGQKIVTDCVIIRVYWGKQLILTAYNCGGVVVHETFKFALDEGVRLMDDNHIKTRDLCDRCKFGNCEESCTYFDACPLCSPFGCRCDFVQQNTPCPYFKEATKNG